MTNYLGVGCIVCLEVLFIIVLSGSFLVAIPSTVTGKLLDVRHVASGYNGGSTMLIISDPIMNYQTVTYERGISGSTLKINSTYTFLFTQNAFKSTSLDSAEVISP